MEIEKAVSSLRTRCEEQFYSFSAYLSKEDAERAALDSVIYSIKNEISICEGVVSRHEHLINTVQSRGQSKRAWVRGFDAGSVETMKLKIKTQKNIIESLNRDLGLLGLL